jgi:acyl carrier protein
LPDPKETTLGVINSLLARRENPDATVSLDSKLQDDLDLDSLELAELSATLEDDLGSDPFSVGEFPETVGQIVAFYDA